MKIHQIVSEDRDIEEAPPGRLSRTFTNVGAKLGMKGSQAKKSVTDDANQMKKDLKVWMAGSKIKGGQLTLDDFKNFLNQKGLPTDSVDQLITQRRQSGGAEDVGGPLKNSDVDSILHDVVAQGYKNTGARGKQSRFAQGTDPSSSVPSEQDAIKLLRSKGYKVMK
jgi:hypothetical protein